MTPLEISIAIHYWCSPTPYKNGPENWTQLEQLIITEMINIELLACQNGTLSGNTPAMKCFMEALQAVPWPTKPWVCAPLPPHAPDRPSGSGGSGG